MDPTGPTDPTIPDPTRHQARLEAYIVGLAKLYARAGGLGTCVALGELVRVAVSPHTLDLDCDSLLAELPTMTSDRLDDLMEFYSYLTDDTEPPPPDEDRSVYHAVGSVRCLVILLLSALGGEAAFPETFTKGLIDSVVAAIRGVPFTHPQARARHADAMARILELAGVELPANDNGDLSFGLELLQNPAPVDSPERFAR